MNEVRHVLLFSMVLFGVSTVDAGYVEEVLQDGPVAYWRLNEMDIDAPVVEFTGNVANGSFDDLGGIEFGEGAIVGDDDGAVSFAFTPGFGCGGACGRADIPVGGVLDILGTDDADQLITLEAWFKLLPTVDDALPPSAFPRIFHYNNFDAGQYSFGVVGDSNAGFPGARTVWAGRGGDAPGILAAETDAIEPSDNEEGEWYHFVATIQEDEYRLFLNGEELTELDDSDPISWQAEQASIGARLQNDEVTLVQSFPGLIDELAIYDSILPDDRIMAHYVAGTTISQNGDYNGDGVVNAADVDLQAVAMKDANPNLATFDENGDGRVDQVDRFIWVKDHAGTWIGDSNLDGEFNSGDLVAVFTAGKFESGQMAAWAEGDWNGDMEFGSGDLVAAFTDGGFEVGPRLAAAAVPEPNSLAVVMAAFTLIAFCRRRRSPRR